MAPRTPSRPRFYLVMAMLMLAVALIGFAKTFFVPVGQGRFEAPAFVFVHGGLFFTWVLLFCLQPLLIRRGAWRTHMALGVFGLVLAVSMAVSGVVVGVWVAGRDFPTQGEFAVSSLLGVCTAMALFLGLVVAGVAFRKRPETHKRLMLLATIAVLWPAWFRFRHYFPAVPHPEIVFALLLADSLILVCMVRDRLVLGRVHPIYLWVGGLIITDHVLEVALFDSQPWRVAAHALLGLLT